LRDRPVVVTLHSTRDVVVDGENVSLGHIAKTLERVDRIIVHQEADARVLSELQINGKIDVVPIGTPSVHKASRQEVRASLGFGTRPVISTFGFLLPHKGTLELIQAVDLLRPALPDILLVAACSIHPDASSDQYRAQCLAEIERRHLEENVVLITEFLPDAEAQSVVGAADLIVMPYKETQESSSAAMRFVLPLGRPIAAPDIAIFADARDALALIPDASPAGLARSIGALLADPERLEEWAARTAAFAKQISWDAIAARHRAIYSSVTRRFGYRPVSSRCER
jgi:glycosyltransferase involved in cell wall biosynthesis